MKARFSCLIASALIVLHSFVGLGQGTAFTYQGLLSVAGASTDVNGSYDFSFTLYTAVTNGSAVAGPIINTATRVSNGVFVASIDFGGVFTGSNYWLDIAVRTNGAVTFTELAPRQPIATTPYAMTANSARSLTGVAPGSVVTNNQTGVSLAGTFTGNGAGLTGLNGTNINSGTIIDTRLSTNVPLLNAASQVWNGTGTNVFGSLVLSNAATANVPLQIYTNLGATNGNNVMLQMGIPGANDLFQITLNPGHGGLGDGSEVGFMANQIAILGNNISGGRIQLGGQGLIAPWALSLQDVGFASVYVPYTANGGIVDWKYGWWNGSTALRPQIDMAVSTVNTTTGNGTLTIFDAFIPAFDNSSPINQPHRLDINSGLGVKNYGASFLDYTSTTSAATNYGINIAQAAQDVYMTGALNVSITNVNAITNTALGTLSALVSDVFFYGGIASNSLTFSNNPALNLTWESELGTAIAPTNVPASNILHVHLILVITGNATNCIANYKLSRYAPVVDVDAQSFFTAVSGSGGSLTLAEKVAVNQLVLGLKNHNLWSRWDCIYPMVGSSSNSCSWNLANTNKYRIAWTTGSATFTSTGFNSDGSASFGDSRFNPATAASPNYTASSGTQGLYNGSALPAGTFPLAFMGAASPGAQAAVGVHDANNFGTWGFNYSSAEGVLSLPSPFNGFTAYSISGGGYYFMSPTGVVSGVTSSNVAPNANFYIGGRNASGLSNPIGAKFGLVMIGGGLNNPDYNSLAMLVNSFVSTLGR